MYIIIIIIVQYIHLYMQCVIVRTSILHARQSDEQTRYVLYIKLVMYNNYNNFY